MTSESPTCPICFEEIEIFAYGDCNHQLCYVCSSRLRSLCKDKSCPLCRYTSEFVVHRWDFKDYSTIEVSNYLFDEEEKIYFEDQDCYDNFCDLIDHVCQYCPRPIRFRHFSNYLKHMESCHGRYYCNLCIENCNLFTFERNDYTRSDLARHRSEGFDCSPNNLPKHPLCNVCHTRFFDADALYSHQKLSHHFCPLCPNTFIFYGELAELETHFRKHHYVCSVGECKFQRPSNVFNTEIELNLHMASEHGMSQGPRNSVDFISTYVTIPKPCQPEVSNIDPRNDSFFIDRTLFPPLSSNGDGVARTQPRGCWAAKNNRSDARADRVPNTGIQPKLNGVWKKNAKPSIVKKSTPTEIKNDNILNFIRNGDQSVGNGNVPRPAVSNPMSNGVWNGCVKKVGSRKPRGFKHKN